MFDFSLSTEEIAAIDVLYIGLRNGPDPEEINITAHLKSKIEVRPCVAHRPQPR